MTKQQSPQQGHLSTLPMLFPTPASMTLLGESFRFDESVSLVSLAGVEPSANAAVMEILKKNGVKSVKVKKQLPKHIDGNYIVLGLSSSAALPAAILNEEDTVAQGRKEGYSVISKVVDKGAMIALVGNDDQGLFYAIQSFRQLYQAKRFPSLKISDFPSLPIRGTIEGFYGKPWTMQERKNHLQFLATVKANTYVYSPKDDPYARDKWRDPYPEALLNELGQLAAVAKENHINFVYAISPGPTVCFSCENDKLALKEKFHALRKVGIRSFYVALDDIEYKEWNCEQDSLTFGPSGEEAAAIAQSQLLNALQAHLKDIDPSSPNLIMVPTEYYDAKETPYKKALREHLNEDIVRQWTGTDVVPAAISIGDAKTATKAFGKKTLLWDNYPVNDFGESAGRLLLAPYERREAGLSSELEGIFSNPMNQEVASRPAVTGVVAFAWNDKAYDAQQTLQFSARELAHQDAQATAALLLFFDTQHLAPTFGSQPWQPQSPKLRVLLNEVRYVLAQGDKGAIDAALQQLHAYAEAFTQAPELIREGTKDTNFSGEAAPWLDAMTIWGKALQSAVEGLTAAAAGDPSATAHFDNAKLLAKEAAVIPSIPGATRVEGPVKIADGVLDVFIEEANQLIFLPQ